MSSILSQVVHDLGYVWLGVKTRRMENGERKIGWKMASSTV